MAATVNVNGRISGERDAVISVFDHGFVYGEGVYETLRTYDGRLFLYDRHMRRLRNSARMIELELPFTDEGLHDQISDTIGAANLGTREAYVRVLVTRGVGDLTYNLNATPKPSVVIIAKPLPDQPAEIYEKGVKVALVDVVRNHPQSVNPMIKSNNLMNSALAAQQAFKRGAFEAVMRNYRGELTECATANLFVVKDSTVRTPPLESGRRRIDRPDTPRDSPCRFRSCPLPHHSPRRRDPPRPDRSVSVQDFLLNCRRKALRSRNPPRSAARPTMENTPVISTFAFLLSGFREEVGRLHAGMEPAGSGATWTSEARLKAETWERRSQKLGNPSDLQLLQKTFDRMK